MPENVYPLSYSGESIDGALGVLLNNSASQGQVLKADGSHGVVWDNETFTGSVSGANNLVVVAGANRLSNLQAGANGNALFWQNGPSWRSNEGEYLKSTNAASGTVLTADGFGGVSWENPPETGMENPMTAVGDLIIGGTSGAPARLAKGTSDQILAIDSNGTAPTWITPTWTSNTGTVTSVRVQAGSGLVSSQNTAQSSTLDTTISIDSGYTLPTTTDWNAKMSNPMTA